MDNYHKCVYLLIFIYFKFSPVIGSSKTLQTMSFNKSSEFSKVMVEIFTSCKKEHYSILYYHENDSEDILNNSFWSSLFSSVIYLNEMLMIKMEKKLFESRIDAFILIAHSKDNLEQVLLNFGSTSWWNIMIPFYIFDESNTNCTRAFESFNVINSIGLLEAYYVCKNSKGQHSVYTFNPFTDYAPYPWEKYEHRDQSADNLDHWVLYHRLYNKGTLCDEFSFDRTRYLNKYPIRAGNPIFNDASDIPMFTYSEDRERKEFIEKTLNVVFETFTLELPKTTSEQNHSELYDAFYSIHENKNLKINFIPTMVNYVHRWSFQNTFPVSWTSFGILTHKRGFKTPLEKIQDFYGIWILISLTLILSLTFFVIWFSSKKNKRTSAAFDIVRLLINASIFAEIDKLSLKVFFSMVFLYFLVIHATFSGHLAEFLTKPELRELPETLDDLKNPIFKEIAVTGLGASIIIDPTLIKKIVYVINQNSCVSMVVDNASVVCIDNYNYLLQSSIISELHCNQYPFNLRFYTHLMRKNWNLNQRFNNFYMIMMECGLSNIFSKKKYDEFIISIKMDTANGDNYIRALDLKSLDFAFIMLGIGLAIALIVFIIEYLYFYCKQSWTQKVIVM